MIVREKAPKYIALTWQEFCAHIQHDGGWLPRDAVVMGHRCEQNTTRTGYFVYEKDGNSCVMNENSIFLFYTVIILSMFLLIHQNLFGKSMNKLFLDKWRIYISD